MFRVVAQIFTGFGELFPDIKTRRFVVVSIILLFPILFWLIDSQTNLFFFWYLQKKVNILKDLYLLNSNIAMSKGDFNDIYAQILNELRSHEYFSISERLVQIFESTEILLSRMFSFTIFWKFLSGSLLGLIATIFFIIQIVEDKSRATPNTILGGVIFALIGGFISILIPTIFTPLVNYISSPMIQIILLITMGISSNNSDSSNSHNLSESQNH